MTKWFFNDKLQVFTSDKFHLSIELNKFYETEVYMNCISLGKLNICWKLPKEGRDFICVEEYPYIICGKKEIKNYLKNKQILDK